MTFRAAKTARPRPMGLLTKAEPEKPERRRGYPYAVGDRIAGDLTVIGHLAEGRLGHLYQVWSADEWCAFTCKILDEERRDDRRAVAALRREARILRRLDHPNLVRGFGEGEHEGLPYLLMEYLEGPSVFELLEARPRRRFELADAIRTALHIGAGLYHLHRRGWLHLDLKPANLLLRDGVPVLVDFDTARRAHPDRKPTGVLGTAPYMAPEQARREPLSAAADVYGLGALLYELTTGRWTYEAVFAGREAREGLQRRFPQLGSAPPPPPREWNPDIPVSLERTILRCLALDPTDRFPSLHPVLLALTAELDEPTAFWPEDVRAERRSEPRM